MIFNLGHSLDRPDHPAVSLNLQSAPYNTQGLTMTAIANKGSGKSNLLAVLAEEAHRNHLPFCVIDPNGDAASLRVLGDDVIVVGRQSGNDLRAAHFKFEQAWNDPAYFIKDLLLDEGFSLVLDLSGHQTADKAVFMAEFLAAYYRVTEDEQYRRPALLLIDEAHQFAPQSRPSEAQKLSLAEMVKIASDGRKRGIAAVYVTQRMAFMSKDVVGLSNVWLIGQTAFDTDYKRLKDYLPPKVSFNQISNLGVGQYYLVGSRGHGTIQVRLRTTPDLGVTPAFKTVQRGERPSLKSLQMPLFQELPTKGENE